MAIERANLHRPFSEGFFLAKKGFIRILVYIMVIHMRHTRAHTGNRRSHHALRANTIVTDKETGAQHLRHRVSLETGTYRGKQIIDVAKKALKKVKKTS